MYSFHSILSLYSQTRVRFRLVSWTFSKMKIINCGWLWCANTFGFVFKKIKFFKEPLWSRYLFNLKLIKKKRINGDRGGEKWWPKRRWCLSLFSKGLNHNIECWTKERSHILCVCMRISLTYNTMLFDETLWFEANTDRLAAFDWKWPAQPMSCEFVFKT